MIENLLRNRMFRQALLHLHSIQCRLLNGLVKPNSAPIFILGNQKSGTTAVAQIMAHAAGLSVTSDLRGLYEPSQTQLHSGELSVRDFVSRNRVDFSRDIVKEPCLTFLAQELLNYFPNARFVFIQRDPRSNIRSILNRLDLPGDLEQLQDEDFDRLTPEWQLVLDGKWLGLDGCNYIEMLAQRWNLAAQVKQKVPGTVVIRYENFCADKAGAILMLLNELNLEWQNEIDSIKDVQFQPRGNSRVTWSQFFGNNLSVIESQCRDQMKQFGYEVSSGLENTDAVPLLFPNIDSPP